MSAPALERIHSNGDVRSSAAEGFEEWICRRLGIEKQNNWPLAPITAIADGENTGDAYWLRADPVHLRVNRDQLVLADSTAFEITEAEAAGFTEALNKHFATDGLIFQAPHPTRWYIRHESPLDLHCTSLSDAIGKNIDRLLPTGSEARRFCSLFNEAQMLLFAHPLNEAREKNGQLPINSVWFWGGGTMPTVEKTNIAGIWTNNHLARSLALAASIPAAGLPTNAGSWLNGNPVGECWIVLDQLQTPIRYGDAFGWSQALTELDQAWFAPLTKMLQAGQISNLTVTGFGDEKYVEITITRSDLWKFWRRSRRLIDL